MFAITTSPLHKHIADFTGLTSTISSWLPTHDAQHAQLHGRDLIAIAPIAAPEPSATPEAVPIWVASAPAELVAAPDADRARAPELAQAPPDQPIVATTEVAQLLPATASPPPPPPPPPPALAPDLRRPPAAPPSPHQDVNALVEQGKAFVEIGDLVAARILFRRAAKAGDAAAAIAMGATYDPVVLAERGVRGVAADLDKPLPGMSAPRTWDRPKAPAASRCWRTDEETAHEIEESRMSLSLMRATALPRKRAEG